VLSTSYELHISYQKSEIDTDKKPDTLGTERENVPDADTHRKVPIVTLRCMFILRASLSVYRQQYRFYRSLTRNSISVTPTKMDVNLTETENSICELLDGCTKFLESEKGTRTSCRIAGGWVRDKVNSFTTGIVIQPKTTKLFNRHSCWACKVTTWILL